MPTIEVIYQDKGVDKVLSNAKKVESSVDALKSKLRSPLGMGDDALKMKNFAAATQGVSKSFKQLGIDIGGLRRESRGLNSIGTAMDNNAKKAQNFGTQLGFLGRLLVAMGVRKVVHDIIELTDAYTNFQNKLKVVLNGQAALNIATKDLIAISNESRVGLEETGILFSRITQATAALGKTQSQVTQFTSTMNKAIQVSGASSMEAKNAIVQLSQGMALGTLRGQDLKSVLEFLPYVSKLIADKMGVAVGALKTLGAEGKITTDTVFNALIESTGEVNEKFARMTPTISQAFEVLKNKYLVALGEATPITKYLALSLKYLADNFDVVIKAATALGVAITALWLGSSFKSLVVFLASNPMTLLIGGLVAAGVALFAFGDKMTDTGNKADALGQKVDSLKKHMDAYDMKDTFLEVAKKDLDDVWTSLSKIVSMSSGQGIAIKLYIVDWDSVYLRLASAVDFLRILARPDKTFEALAAKTRLALPPKNYSAEDKAGDEKVVSDMEEFTHRAGTAVLDKRDQAIGRGKDEFQEKQKETEARWNQMMADINKTPIDPASVAAKKKKGHKESGKTFEELIREATFDAQNKTEDDLLERRIENKLHDSLEKLKPSIKKWGIDMGAEIAAAQKEFNNKLNSDYEAYGKPVNEAKYLTAMKQRIAAAREHSAEFQKQKSSLEEQIRLEETLKQKEAEQKIRDASRLKYYEDGKKVVKELADQQKEVEALLAKQGQDHEDKLNATAEILDPGLKANQQIKDLERFKKAAEGMKDGEAYIRLADKAIADLQLTLTAGGRAFLMFGDQMNSIFGPGGTLSQGLADAFVNAKNLGDAMRDLMGTIGKQALSALIQMPINAGLGALTGALSGGPAPSSGGANGVTWWSNLPKHAAGGYTGDFGTGTPAGIVHGQEYVMNAESTRKYRPMLESMNNGGSAPPGNGGGGAQVTVHNYAGVQVETNSMSPNDIQIMITRAVKDQTGPIVANHINDPSSMVSKSINRNLTAERRRL